MKTSRSAGEYVSEYISNFLIELISVVYIVKVTSCNCPSTLIAADSFNFTGRRVSTCQPSSLPLWSWFVTIPTEKLKPSASDAKTICYGKFRWSVTINNADTFSLFIVHQYSSVFMLLMLKYEHL
jgi:hypothetical protein